MGTKGVVKVLGIRLVRPKDTEATGTNSARLPPDLESLKKSTLESLTYNVQPSAVPLFWQDNVPMSETDHLMHVCSDNMFPLAIPSNFMSASIEDFNSIFFRYDGAPDLLGQLLANFCCHICPHVITKSWPVKIPDDTADGVGDFHLRLTAYLKQNYSTRRDNGVESLPRIRVVLNSPNAIIQDTESKEKAQPSMTVDPWGDEWNMYSSYVYKVMVYQWEDSSEGAIRIIVNDSKAMTPDEFYDFCTSPTEEN